MKRMLCLLFALLLLTGCGRTVDLMPKASPSTSVLSLYVYDGETITRQHLFETDTVRAEAMEDFRKAKAKPADVDLTTLQPPYYGLEMGGTDGWTVYGLWADGYFIRGNGKVYEFDYDFEKFRREYDFEEPDEFRVLTVLPCMNYLAKTKNGWNTAVLTLSDFKPVEQPVNAVLIEQTKTHLTIELTNNGAEEWCYGHAFWLETEIDGKWYRIPAEQDVAFTEEGLLVAAGDTAEECCWIEPYGDLPAGTYRLVFYQNLSVEFTIK